MSSPSVERKDVIKMVLAVRRACVSAIFAGCLLTIACKSRPVERADLVLVNGRILTVDPLDTVVEAIAVTDGKIVAVGSGQQIKSRVSDRTRVINLDGRTATPGLIDSHVH